VRNEQARSLRRAGQGYQRADVSGSTHWHERALVSAARDGDTRAFAQLVREHQGPVYRVALRMLGSASDAEDVAQETFVQAWRSLGRFRGDSAVSTWLYRIATNRSLDLIARRRVQGDPLEDADAVAGGVDPAAAAQERAALRAVVDGLLALPAEQRALLVLHELEGLSYAEVADVLHVPPPTVKGRMHRARGALAAVMEEHP
jgi:RNA polymerase sigma-70 factor, ECF subfamily